MNLVFRSKLNSSLVSLFQHVTAARFGNCFHDLLSEIIEPLTDHDHLARLVNVALAQLLYAINHTFFKPLTVVKQFYLIRETVQFKVAS